MIISINNKLTSRNNTNIILTEFKTSLSLDRMNYRIPHPNYT